MVVLIIIIIIIIVIFIIAGIIVCLNKSHTSKHTESRQYPGAHNFACNCQQTDVFIYNEIRKRRKTKK